MACPYLVCCLVLGELIVFPSQSVTVASFVFREVLPCLQSQYYWFRKKWKKISSITFFHTPLKFYVFEVWKIYKAFGNRVSGNLRLYFQNPDHLTCHPYQLITSSATSANHLVFILILARIVLSVILSIPLSFFFFFSS